MYVAGGVHWLIAAGELETGWIGIVALVLIGLTRLAVVMRRREK
jgi:hypothetical protein